MTQYKKKDEKDYLIQPTSEQTAVNTTPAAQPNAAQPTAKPTTVTPNSQTANTTIKQVSNSNKFSYNPSKPVYASPYSAKIDQLFNEIMATPDFSYDPNKDETYLALKDQHINLGQRAMKDTTSQIAAQTGGIASSYAASAGAQAYQNYMNDLSGYIPELKQLAYEMYENERNKKYKDLGTLQDMENDEYNKYLNDLNEYYTDRDIAYNQFLNEQKQDNYLNELLYQREQDALNRQDYLDDKAYNRAQDEWEKQRSEDEFEYRKEQDLLDQQNWETQFNYNKELDDYEKEQDELDRIWDEALTKAERGDFSGLYQLGVDEKAIENAWMSYYKGGSSGGAEDYDPYSNEVLTTFINDYTTKRNAMGTGVSEKTESEAYSALEADRVAGTIDNVQYSMLKEMLDEMYGIRNDISVHTAKEKEKRKDEALAKLRQK